MSRRPGNYASSRVAIVIGLVDVIGDSAHDLEWLGSESGRRASEK
jgi:hypothetical protein